MWPAERAPTADFAERMKMAVANAYFHKREEQAVAYRKGGRGKQVDCLLFRRCNLKELGECEVVTGESEARQHQMAVGRISLVKRRELTGSRGSNGGS